MLGLANYVLTSQQLLYTWAAVEHFPPCQVCWDGESRVVTGTSPVQDYGTVGLLVLQKLVGGGGVLQGLALFRIMGQWDR